MKLGVNIDHIATLRQQRRGVFPSPIEAALAAQNAGADSIVAHLREDRRHIQDQDVFDLKAALSIPLALEMGASEGIMDIALALRPVWVCIVPERRQELTTEGGLDLVGQESRFKTVSRRFQGQGILVSFFIDPNLDQVACAQHLGANAVELHTGTYADATDPAQQLHELTQLQQAGAQAVRLGLHLHAGHGLNYDNVQTIARIPGMEELNIGFSIISRALFVGLSTAVTEMKEKIN